MQKLFNKNILLLFSFLLVLGGLAWVYYLMTGDERNFSLATARKENELARIIILLSGGLGLLLNLAGVYKTFCAEIKFLPALKLLLLNFPLMLLQTVLVWGWLVLNASV